MLGELRLARRRDGRVPEGGPTHGDERKGMRGWSLVDGGAKEVQTGRAREEETQFGGLRVWGGRDRGGRLVSFALKRGPQGGGEEWGVT